MTTSAARLATGAVALSFVALGATPAFAVCDPYSQECVSPQSQGSSTQLEPAAGSPAVRSSSATSPATLPFTGGEVVLIAALGAAAVGGGVALVVAGRRRQVPAT